MTYAVMSILDLVRCTDFIHKVKPNMRDKVVYAVKEPKPSDRSITFCLMPLLGELTEDVKETVILSADYILEHPYWKELGEREENGKTIREE